MGRTISTEELFGSQDNSSSAPDFQQTPDGKRVFSTKALFGEPKSKVVSSGDLFGPAAHLPEFDPKDPEPSTKKANSLEKMVWTNWAGIPEDAVDQFKAREPAAKEKLANAILGPLAAAIPGQTGRSARENLIFGLAPLAEPFSRFVERPLASQFVPLARNWFLNEPLPTAEAPGFIKQFIPQAADPQVWGALNNLMKAYFTVKPQEIEHVKGYEFGKERPEFGDIFSARNIALGIDPKIGKPLAALGGLALRSVMPDIAAGAKKITTAAGETAGKAGAAVGDVAKGVAQAVEAEIQNAYKIFKETTDKQTFVKMMVEQKGMPVDGAKQLAGAFEKFIKDNPQSTSFQPDYGFRSLFPGVQDRPGFIAEAPTKAASNLSAEVNAVRAEAKQLQAKADELAQAGKPIPKDLTETINKLNASIPQPEATGRESEKVQAADKIQQEIEALKGRKSKKDIQKREELETQLEAVAPVEEAPTEDSEREKWIDETAQRNDEGKLGSAPIKKTIEFMQGFTTDERGNLVRVSKEPETVAKEDTQAPPAGRVSQQEPDAATEEPVNRYENSSFKNRDEEIRTKYTAHLEEKGFTGNVPAIEQIDNLKKAARLKTFGSFERYLNLRENKELRWFLKENDISVQEFRDAMHNAPDYVPQEKPKTETKLTVKKAELRPYRKEDGTIGYEAIPIEDQSKPEDKPAPKVTPQVRDEALKSDEKEPPKGTDDLMADPESGFAMFFPKDTPVNDEIKGVQFADPAVEARFKAANGMTSKKSIKEAISEMWKTLLSQARRYPTLPNKPEFFVFKQILEKQGLIKKVAQDRAIRALDAVTVGFGPKKLDLFTRKVILDDLIREAKAGRPVPFGYSEFSETSGELIIRIELLEKDKAMIDALIEQNPDVKAGVERRQKLWAAIQQDLVRYKILKESQLKEDYFRHQILEYAQTKAVHGTGKKLRTPNPGYSRQRMGSTFDINTNYLEAEMEVMSQAFHDIETAKNIEAIEKSPLNVLKTLQDRAKTYNATKVMAYFQAFLDREQALGNPEYLGMTAEKLYRRTLNWKQAMGYAKLGKLASEGYLPTGLNNEFQDVVESLAQRHDEGEADEIENGRMFKYLNYLMNAQDEAGKMGAAMVFKGMAEKKQAIIRILGEQIKTWEDFIPEGYRTWQPKEGRVFYSAYSVPQKVVNELLQNAQPELGEYGITKEDLQKVMAVGGLRKQLVLPEEVADTLDNLYTTPQPNFVMEAARAITTKWKQWVLFNPRRFFKYNYQNFVGDSDAVIAGNPKIFRNTARAVRELENVFFLGRPMPTEMREFFERGGISSTLTVQEIPDIKKLEIFKRFFAEAEKAKSGNIAASILNGYWSKAVEFTMFREAILRYAAYLYYRDVFNSGKVEYAASNPEEIDAMENPLDKAAKVATELLGDYANVSAFTQNMRQFLIPFASWLEVNAKRYYRLGKNAYTGADGAGSGASAGGRLAGVALKKGALGLSAWWLRAAAMTGLVMLYNQLFWGDEESEVSPYDQNRMHLILGRMKDGRIVILRGQGAFSDILEWFGLDAAPQLWREFFEGKASLVDIFGKIPFVTGQIGLKPVFQKIIRGVTPLYKIPFETMTGRTLPVFDDRPGKIEDPVRNILKGISLENEYDKLTGRPTRGYFRSLLESFVAIQDPMENAYRYIQSQKYEYLEKWKGRGGMSDYYSPRSIVYRQYKKALVFKDKDAEERALAEIRKLGTTAKQFQSSMKAADPLYGLSKADKQEFTQKFLMPRDKAKLEKALTYYKKTFGWSRD